MPLTTYCHQQSKTPQKSAKKGSESAKKANLYGKSTQRLNKTKNVSKSLFKAQVATELFKASTPTTTPKRSNNNEPTSSMRTPAGVTPSRRKIDFITFLDDSYLPNASVSKKQLSSQSGGQRNQSSGGQRKIFNLDAMAKNRRK